MVQQPWKSLGSRAEVPVSARDPSLKTQALSSPPEDRTTSDHLEGAAASAGKKRCMFGGGGGRFRELI